MNSPKVSVVIPVHNEEAFLAEAIESALAQDYPNLEVVVADDGSTDRTREIAIDFAERDPERVVVLYDQCNQGKAVAANRALAATTGQLIAWLDGDDVMLPGKLSSQVALLEGRPEAVGCCHDAEIFDWDSDTVLGRFSTLVNGRPFREGGVELWFDPTYRHLPSATMVRASACPPHGLDPRLTRANDWLFDIEVFRQGPCVVSQDVLVRYRRHAGQLTDPRHRAQWFEEGLMVMAIVEARYPELQAAARTMRTALLLGDARRQMSSGQKRRALRRSWGALRAGGMLAVGRVARHVVRARQDRLRARRP